MHSKHVKLRDKLTKVRSFLNSFKACRGGLFKSLLAKICCVTVPCLHCLYKSGCVIHYFSLQYNLEMIQVVLHFTLSILYPFEKASLHFKSVFVLVNKELW